VTNNHVIEGADDVRVALADGREFQSRILLKDERFDLAILQIDGEGPFPIIEFGDTDALKWATSCWPSATPSASVRP
jgi:S1-C subfamily serine protease